MTAPFSRLRSYSVRSSAVTTITGTSRHSATARSRPLDEGGYCGAVEGNGGSGAEVPFGFVAAVDGTDSRHRPLRIHFP